MRRTRLRKLVFVFPSCADKKNHPVSIVYVPSHLYHMLFELFKVRHLLELLVVIIKKYIYLILFIIYFLKRDFSFFVECHESNYRDPREQQQPSTHSSHGVSWRRGHVSQGGFQTLLLSMVILVNMEIAKMNFLDVFTRLYSMKTKKCSGSRWFTFSWSSIQTNHV